MNQKFEFVAYAPYTGGTRILTATTWVEVVSELYERGMVNVGKVKVVKRTYQWVCDEPQLIDTDYKNG